MPNPARLPAQTTTVVTALEVNPPVGGLRADEHRPVLRRPGAPGLQVGDDPFPDIGRQRQPIMPVPFAPHRDLTTPPVDVVHHQCGHLTGAQPQPHQHGEDRQVPATGRGPLIAAGQ
jgi:hypothetical protein